MRAKKRAMPAGVQVYRKVGRWKAGGPVQRYIQAVGPWGCAVGR